MAGDPVPVIISSRWRSAVAWRAGKHLGSIVEIEATDAGEHRTIARLALVLGYRRFAGIMASACAERHYRSQQAAC